jgi:hypothetical protein
MSGAAQFCIARRLPGRAAISGYAPRMSPSARAFGAMALAHAGYNEKP